MVSITALVSRLSHSRLLLLLWWLCGSISWLNLFVSGQLGLDKLQAVVGQRGRLLTRQAYTRLYVSTVKKTY